MIEDICARLDSQEVASSLINEDGNAALICSTLAENIAAANWMTVLGLVKKSIRNLDWRIDGRTPATNTAVDLHAGRALGQYYSRKEKTPHTLKKYWNESREQVVNNMVQFGLSTTPVLGDISHSSSVLEDHTRKQIYAQRNWSYILWSLEFFISQASELSNSMAIRVANLEGRTSNHLADAAQRLAGLGIIFLPLSFSTGLLSMGGNFLPGNRLFWVFFV